MQKLDFTENLKDLMGLLKSESIVKFIDDQPNNQGINTKPLTPLIIESKSNYDKINNNDPKFEILRALNAPNLYSEKKIGDLINDSLNISGNQKVHFFLVANLLDFYNLHFTIIRTSQLAEKVLFNEKLSELNENDTIIFRVLTDGNLDITRYSKILTLLSELVEIIQKIYSEELKAPTLNLLDSGSDTNFGLKTTVETAKSLFQIFKEVWDWMLNRKFYKSKLRNAALLDNLNVMMAIKEAQDRGAINEDTAKIYKETLIRRTEDLLELNVVPKLLVMPKTVEESKKLLQEYTEIKMLESGK